ncbi:hypothetical protein [Psychrobacter sp. I-STPA6b]|uniref:hypothetical protein n=1 Tax=Psychrobacter sp. I-STPA6b TaxID=2585718 RepID=UPI001D0BF7BC|nr:hypothetical protein [Psychrobacter sp. I-STPA6b]
MSQRQTQQPQPITTLTYHIDNQPYSIKTICHPQSQLSLLQSQQPTPEAINIYASGASIEQVDFSIQRCQTPAIFVNGSITLTEKHSFSQIYAYVITDARFVQNGLDVLRQHYQGQPLYLTQPVLEALITHLPNLVTQYHTRICVIFAVDRPLLPPPDSLWQKLCSKWLEKRKRIALEQIQNSFAFVIESQHTPVLGVSLDIRHGFVEAGTVAYVACQLAFSMGSTAIHIFGVDLLNHNQPRFYESPQKNAPCKLDKAIYNRIAPSFALLATTYAQHQVSIYNHSPISKDLLTGLIYADD